jgi:zinc transporter ZupT
MKEKDRIAAGLCQSLGQSLAFLTLSIDASFATGFFCLSPDVMIAPIFTSGEFP